MKGPLLLTGASGWFGRTALWEYEQEHGPEALRRDVIPFASREQLVDFDSPHGPVKALPLEEITAVQNPRGLLHLAFLTRDKVEELGWRRYVEVNRAITAKVADVLRLWPTMPVVATSSGAAAALDGQEPDLEGNPYATLKQEEEALLERESATRMAMVFRVYAATGRFMTRPEKFALGNFILQAIMTGTILISSPSKVFRGYVSSENLFQLIWKIIQDHHGCIGFRSVAACSHVLEIGDVAKFVASHIVSDIVRGESHFPESDQHYYYGSDEFVEIADAWHVRLDAYDTQVANTIAGLATSPQLQSFLLAR